MEIERKWLLDAKWVSNVLLVSYPVDSHYQIEQSYLSINPEVRIRHIVTIDGDFEYPYKLTIKGNGDLIREEVELPLSNDQYTSLLTLLDNKVPIQKDVYIYQINRYRIEVVKVDNEWAYAEVEFESKDEADQYCFPFPYIEEVTYDNDYKMKNYWCSTHCT